MGKTRVSLQVAAALINEFEGGVYFVLLSAVRDPELIASAIAQSVGIQVSGNRLPVEAVNEFLMDRDVLLVLDNFEQLLPDGAPIIAQLLQASPRVKVVASSRAALKVYGEQERALEPLRTPSLRALPSLAALLQFVAGALLLAREVAATHALP